MQKVGLLLGLLNHGSAEPWLMREKNRSRSFDFAQDDAVARGWCEDGRRREGDGALFYERAGKTKGAPGLGAPLLDALRRVGDYFLVAL
jgi:hypothetical protein